jgi:undecaprenyl-diphosphatase
MLETLKLLDRQLFLFINHAHYPWLDSIMWTLSATWPTVVLVLVAAWYLYNRVSPRRAAHFVLGCALIAAFTDFTSNAIKHSAKRYRPTHNLEIRHHVQTVNDYKGGKYGFFSGHSANTAAVTTFAFLCFSWTANRLRLLFYIYPLAVGYSRIYLGVHYPADVAAGFLYGLCTGLGGFLLMQRFFFTDEKAVA